MFDLKARIALTAKRRNRVILPSIAGLIAGLFIGGLVMGYELHTIVLLSALAGALLTAVFYQDPLRYLSQQEYYGLPGSRDNGKHRCVMCGHPGIYKHGQYKSDNVFSDCSKCEAQLFKN